MKAKRFFIVTLALALVFGCMITAGGRSNTAMAEGLANFSDDFESYEVGSYIENTAGFNATWENNVLKGGEAQGMDGHLVNVAKIEYEDSTKTNKVLHLNNTTGNDSFFYIGPAGDYRVKNFSASFRLKYLVEGVSERSWVGLSFRKKAPIHYTGTNNLMFTTQRYKANTQVTGHPYAIINGGSPNDLSTDASGALYGSILSVESMTYNVPSATNEQDLPWIEYRLDVEGNNYKLYVNDNLIIDCTFGINSYDYYGYLSLNCCQANVLVDDFAVTVNDTELPPSIDPLPAPVVSYNEESGRFEWQAVDGANIYAVYVNGELMTTKARTYYEMSADLAAGEYTIQVIAISADSFLAKDSPLSEAKTYVVQGEEPTPESSSKGGCKSAINGTSLIFMAMLIGAFALKKRNEKQ